MTFEAGDLVQLKSGGPVMTVEQVGKTAMLETDAVWCTWFEMTKGKRELQRETFAPVTLEKVKRSEAPLRVVPS